jgi:hypothetical protein
LTAEDQFVETSLQENCDRECMGRLMGETMPQAPGLSMIVTAAGGAAEAEMTTDSLRGGDRARPMRISGATVAD